MIFLFYKPIITRKEYKIVMLSLSRLGRYTTMYTIHAPPHHKDGIIRATKELAESNGIDFDGVTSE